MDKDNGKGKAIAIESNGNISGEGTWNQGERPDGSRATREINLGASCPNNNNFGVDTSDQWVMRGGTFMREINLPPLARRSIYDSRMNPNFRWVRVYVPPTIPPSNFNNFVEGTSGQGVTTFSHSTAMETNLSAPLPFFDIYGRLVYLPNAPEVVMFSSYPIIRDINFHAPLPNLNNSGEGTSSQGVGRHGGGFTETAASCARFVSSLNPNAPEWCEAPSEARSLFITFSHGYPLTTKQIFWFLAVSFGIKSLSEVDINQPREGPAHFGRLVFTAVTIPMLILRGREEARIMIYGKSMICKKWRPKKDWRRPDRR